jgi:hypothetical protein
MDKYYTPEIEDFYSGYTYEFKTHDGVNYTKEEFDKMPWREGIYGFNDFPYVERSMKGRMQHQTVRVKFLNRGDIESLGWEYQHDIQYQDGSSLEQYYKGGISLTPIYEKSKLIIWEPNKTYYQGKCPSINELRKILQWIL